MSRVVLDACALLAILNQESAAERLIAGALERRGHPHRHSGRSAQQTCWPGLRRDHAWEAALGPMRLAFPLPLGTPGSQARIRVIG
jgi:hypothetical protein